MRIFTIALALVFSLFITNTALAATEVFDTLPGDTTWTLAESPYVITSDLSIPVGVTLTIEPGVVVKFHDSYTTLTVDGNLEAIGTASDPIIFTAYKDDAAGGDTNGDGSASFPGTPTFPPVGDWRGIFFNTGSISHIVHASIRYGGQIFFSGFGYQRNPMVRNNGGTLFIDSTELRPGPYASEAFNQTDGGTTVTNSHFTTGRVFVVSGGTFTIHGSTFAQSSDAIINNSPNAIDATGNWWGDASGPTHTNNPDGIGSRVTGDVSFAPFLTADPTVTTITLSDATMPTTGSASTPVTFKITYTNSFNQPPTSVRLVAEGENSPCPAMDGGPMLSALFIKTAYAAEGDGCAMEVDTTAEATLHDGNFANGEQYILTQQFPAGNFTYHFEADGVRTPEFDEVTLTVSDGPAPCTVDCFSNVLFLPGIEGSRLYWTDPSCILINCENKLWVPNRDDDVEKLYMATGTSLLQNIYAKEDDILLDGPFGANFYKALAGDMNSMVASSMINAWKPIAYDWRYGYDQLLSGGLDIDGKIYYDVPTSFPYIVEELYALASSSKTKKVTIVAHSNGGLLAKALIQKLEDSGRADLVDNLILVASPQLGTPQAIGALLHGYDATKLRFYVGKSTQRKLAHDMSMTYNLLPSEKYLSVVSTPVITFDKDVPDHNLWGDEINSTGEYLAYLLGGDNRTNPDFGELEDPTIANETLLSGALEWHANFDDWTAPTTTTVYQIAGWGNDTVSGIRYSNDAWLSDFSWDYEPILTEDGDGTVVTPSALGNDGQKYWVDLNKYRGDTDSVLTHADIFEVPQLRTLIKNIIRKEDITNPGQYISATRPSAFTIEKRLRYFLHSPLTLELYDSTGRHVGVSTTTGLVEEQVPGATYNEFGEVKYISVPASASTTLIMRGDGSGRFTLNVEEVTGGIITATTTFANIPVSTSTFVAMSVSENPILSALPGLSIDQDGNGTIDTHVLPGTIFRPDLTPPTTTASTTGTRGTNHWYTSNVLVTLVAADTESGVASTSYSVNGGAWTAYTTPFNMTTEGISTVLYRSTDTAGNTEATNTLALKIDKTAPEAQISVSTTTQDILVEGIDNLGTTTISKDTSGNVTLTDQAGHTTKLFFQKTYSGKILTYAKLTGIQYDSDTKITLPSASFLYVWDTKAPIVPLSQTIAIDGAYLLQASYNKKTNKTIVIVFKKNFPIQTQTFTGLKIVKLTTSGGVVGYSW